MSRTITAAVLREAGAPFELAEVVIDDPRPDEVLVRLRGVGVCRSDTHAMHDVPPPAVLGHEGAGVVEEVGSSVTGVEPGDPVALSFRSCGACARCRSGRPAYCDSFLGLNFSGARPDGSSALALGDGTPLYAHFLGQSSFATHCLVQERSAVRLESEGDLALAGPFGCGFQTGAGAVLNALRPSVASSIAVLGAGAVGLAAIAAARLAGCRPIVALDVSSKRLELAAGLGASVLVDTSDPGWPAALRRAVPAGLDHALDTTGIGPLVGELVSCLHTRGVCGIVGAGPSAELSLDWRTLLNGRTVTGIIAGDSVPQLFVPELLALQRDGLLGLDRLVVEYAFEDLNDAVAASERGEVVKPVLRF